MAMGTNTHIFDCGRGYGETKSPSSCKWPVTPEGVIVLHCETCSKNDCFIYKPIYRKKGNKKFINEKTKSNS